MAAKKKSAVKKSAVKKSAVKKSAVKKSVGKKSVGKKTAVKKTKAAAPKIPGLKAAEAALRKIGMGFPETTEDFPWGHRALKVKGKAFVFMASEDGEFSLSVKLPDSCDFALMQPYASPTGYGLGKSGWVTARFAKKDKVPVSLLGTWLRESYLAVAPKKLGAALRERGG